jgi:hypothetical protein
MCIRDSIAAGRGPNGAARRQEMHPPGDCGWARPRPRNISCLAARPVLVARAALAVERRLGSASTPAVTDRPRCNGHRASRSAARPAAICKASRHAEASAGADGACDRTLRWPARATLVHGGVAASLCEVCRTCNSTQFLQLTHHGAKVTSRDPHSGVDIRGFAVAEVRSSIEPCRIDHAAASWGGTAMRAHPIRGKPQNRARE